VRIAGDGKVIPQDVGYTLGQKDTSPLHMARAYATFAAAASPATTSPSPRSSSATADRSTLRSRTAGG
jgi:membrane peptidoglycan carboxypeptidase